MTSLRGTAVVGGVMVALLVGWVWAAGVTQAQEGEEWPCGEPATAPVQPEDEGLQRFQQIAGPYNVRAAIVQSSLSLGTTLVAVYVLEESTCQPVSDARVLLRTRHQGADSEGIATAHNTPGEPERYDAQMTLDAPGEWRVTVDISSALGDVSVEVPTLTVAETRRVSGGTYVFIGAFLLIIAGAAYLWWSTQRRRRRLGPTSHPGDGAGPGDDAASGPALS